MQGTAAPTATPSAEPTPVEQAWSLAEDAPEERRRGGGGHCANLGQNETVGSLIDGLDSLALSLGNIRISVFDVLIVAVILIGVLFGAWLISKFARRGVRRFTKLDDTQQLLAEKILTIMVCTAFFLGIDLLGIDLTALAVFSGAFGLAIGFGLRRPSVTLSPASSC